MDIRRTQQRLNSESSKTSVNTDTLLKINLDELEQISGVDRNLVRSAAIAYAMAPNAIVFALSNPDPEIDPLLARKHARVVATGRSDHPNQINNVLAFPGIFRGLLDAGADRIGLADTVGYADPAWVKRLFEQALKVAGATLCCGHFHDTRGLALANVAAALDMGITRFDASLAGLGGCPFAPGASGNATTEDLAFMLEAMGPWPRA